MDRISKAMLQVADGNLAEDVPYRGRHDEVGRLADALVVFKDGMIARQNLEGAQREDQQLARRRQQAVETCDRLVRVNSSVGPWTHWRQPQFRCARTSGEMSSLAADTEQRSEHHRRRHRAGVQRSAKRRGRIGTAVGIDCGDQPAGRAGCGHLAGGCRSRSSNLRRHGRSQRAAIASAKSSSRSRRSPARPTCLPSTRPSRRRAPARQAEGLRWSPRK